MIQSISITNISKKEKTLEIDRSDGKKSNFHFMWLRDNCPLGVHKEARHRIFNFLTVSENIYPESSTITQDGKLEINWSEDNHKSLFDPLWLRKNCYTINNNKKYNNKRSVLHTNIINLRRIFYHFHPSFRSVAYDQQNSFNYVIYYQSSKNPLYWHLQIVK